MNRTVLFFILLIKALFMVLVILYGSIGLGPDEAQYWTWSRHLDWGYYSKPPGIAWQIAAGTYFFGDTELGVRIGSVLIGLLLPIGIYLLARACKLSEEYSAWAGLAFALTPLGFLSSLFAITDVGMVFFWTLGCVVICRGLEANQLQSYLLGLLIGLGALFKWPIYLLWVAILIWRPSFFNLHFLGGVIVSLLGLLPSLYWNISHDWATFKHVSATVVQPETASGKPNFLEFFGAQVGLFSPILFGLLIYSFFKKASNDALNFCKWLTILILVPFLGISLFKKMQGNWCDYVYPTAIVWMTAVCLPRFKKLYEWGIALSLAIVLVVIYISPFKHNVGWRELSSTLLDAGYDPQQDFLFGDKYQNTSILSFYGPQQKQAYFFNIDGARKNQFFYWPRMKDQAQGKTGYFMTVDSHQDFEPKLIPYFENVELVLTKSLTPKKQIKIYRADGYNGSEPEEVEKY